MITSAFDNALPEVTRPLTSTVTLPYVPATTPEFDKIIVFDAVAIVASPINAGSLAIDKVPDAKLVPKFKKFNVDNDPRPKLVLATVADATSDKLFTANNDPTPTAPEAAGT